MTRPPDDPAPPLEASEPGWELRVETCRIELRRTDGTASFHARSDDGEGRSVCEPSTPFRWPSALPPDSEEARLAHYELVSRLKAGGWAPTGTGDLWYATMFARSVLGAPRTTEPAAPEPEPEPEPRVEPDPPREPEPVRATQPEPAAEAARARFDAWRVAALAGCACAAGLLAWLLMQ